MTLADRATATGFLFTDEYQLTMAQVYFRMGLHETPAQFDHFFRSYPDYGAHQAGYCINAGLEWLVDWMRTAHVRDQDLDYLRSQRSRVGDQLFAEDFLARLRRAGSFDGLDLCAIPEGRVVHPNVPLSVVRGPLAMAQILESPLLNAEVYPDDCLLLVDTISTLDSGVPNAIKVFEELRRQGHQPTGIRLDSGDLAYLSIQAAKLLDASGFAGTSIVLSNNLDELVIWQIITQIQDEAPRYGVDPDQLIKRLVYGVGTGLITSRGEPALDGVYKLVALKNREAWVPAIKLSETPEKIINPGDKRV